MWAIEQVEDWLMEDAWQRPQGVRASNNPMTRIVRFRIVNIDFMVKSYTLFKKITKARPTSCLSSANGVTEGYDSCQ
jgi:hypothetical protein